ncbi:Glucose dehydrogenase [FAD, quinone] [Leucoagaricus sp. SymC.cos]|nr:Glucose dehydrogenase [FAD, quinone] [Leucoagaricus sp. SymC.cos]
MKLQTLLLYTLLGLRSTLAAVFFQSPDDLPQDIDYDFIIVGGGTGGGVVAGRLAENPDWKILAIEAGPSHKDVFKTVPPGLWNELRGTIVDWNYTLVAQTGINNQSRDYSRAKLLGGCSSHNGLVYTRGAKDDWDHWAEVTGDEGLKWDNILPLMFKAKKLVKDSENQPEQGHLDTSVHGHNGSVFVSAPYLNHPFNEMMLQAAKELPEEFPFVLDYNGGTPIGISWAQFTIDNKAQRSSSATAYIDPSGDNLHILLNTYVTRVVPTSENSTNLHGVEFAVNEQSERKQLFANKEVIVSGGVIGTPQILLNSGIGNRDDLEALGVTTIVDNPSVGRNFSDQVYTIMLFNTTIQNTEEFTFVLHSFDRDAALAEWNETRTGPMASTGHLRNQITWVRLPDEAPPFSQQGFYDPSPGKTAPHIEIYTTQISKHVPETNGEVAIPPDVRNITTLQLTVINLHPVSRGSITLNSSNPFTYPIVDAGLLLSEIDVSILREGLRSAGRLFTTAPVFHNLIGETVYPTHNVTSDEDLEAFIRDSSGPYLHGGCSAMMSPRNATWGVVDPDFKVKGTSGLRVADASVFPSVPSGHTQAAVYGIAERASMLIAEAYGE